MVRDLLGEGIPTRPVMRITGRSPLVRRMASRTPRPSMSGIMMSRTASSGGDSSNPDGGGGIDEVLWSGHECVQLELS